jgi:hypothetical protein
VCAYLDLIVDYLLFHINFGGCLSHNEFVLIIRIFAGSGDLLVNRPIALETVIKIQLELSILLNLSLRGSS